jgi:hypothetical protein
MRLKLNPVVEVDELLGDGLGAVEAVSGTAVGLAVVGGVVGLAVVGVGRAVAVAGAPALGEEAVTAPWALCAHAVTRHPADRMTAASSKFCMRRRIPDPSMA